MPSKDTFHSKNPTLNEGLENGPVSSGQGKRRATKRSVSAQIVRLAERLNVDPDKLAEKVPEDTIRRTKYPVIEIQNPDGTRSFKHDPQIEEGVRGQIRP